MDFEKSLDHTGTRTRVDIGFNHSDLEQVSYSQATNDVEAVVAMGREAGHMLLTYGIDGEALIVSPLYGFGFHPTISFAFLRGLRSVPGLELREED